VFIGDEVLLGVGFGTARARLGRLAQGNLLLGSSEDAYAYGRVGAAWVSKLVQVQVRALAESEGCARWAIRWEAPGPGGRLFPVLDADLTLTPGEEHATLLGLTGAYRPPFGPLGGALDRAVLHRVAAATIRNFLARVAEQITAEPACSGLFPEV
jgi:hypothetical protein